MDYISEYRERILDRVKVELNPASLVLDVGCGEGWHGLEFAKVGRAVIGIDISPSPIWQKIKKKNLYFVTSDICSLPFASETFDIIYSKDVLHHLDEPERAVKEIMRVAKKGGKIYFIEANRYNPLLYIHLTLMAHHQHFTQDYFKELLSKCSKNVKFIFSETHAFPVNIKFLRKIFYFIEDLVEKIPLFRKFLAYNIAIIVKEF